MGSKPKPCKFFKTNYKNSLYQDNTGQTCGQNSHVVFGGFGQIEQRGVFEGDQIGHVGRFLVPGIRLIGTKV